MGQKINTAAWLHIVYGLLILFIGVFVFIILIGSGMLSGDVTALAITSGVGILVGIIFVLIALPSLLAGYGLLKRYEWGRVLAFVMSIIHLFSFPIGTAVGGYTLWVLTREEARREFV